MAGGRASSVSSHTSGTSNGAILVAPQIGGAVRVQGLEKGFGDWPVLWDLNLTVDWGELLVLFGTNGVGKTTLLRILSTQTRPDAGSLQVAGFNPRRDADAVRRRVGVVGHQTFLYGDMTCQENLVHYGRLYGLDQCHIKAEEALSRLGLTDRADHRVRTLSNGMQRRLSIARAILHQPQLLLLDEPEAGLDPESVDALRALLREWTSKGYSVIMTTHDLELGLSWASRAGVLSRGKIHFPSENEYNDGAAIRKVLVPYSETGPAPSREPSL